MNQYRIGLLGGLGPISTGVFYNLLIDKLQKSGHINSNIDFPNIIINSIPAPELTSADISNSLIVPYINGLKLLQSLNGDIIFMICNSIHVYFDAVKKSSGATNLISIRDVVQKKLETYKDRTICVLGMPSTVNSGLYSYESLHYANPDTEELKQLGEMVNQYNSLGNRKLASKTLNNIISKKKREGADVFLLACTEVSAIAKDIKGTLFEDTLEIMADFILHQFLSWKSVQNGS